MSSGSKRTLNKPSKGAGRHDAAKRAKVVQEEEEVFDTINHSDDDGSAAEDSDFALDGTDQSDVESGDEIGAQPEATGSINHDKLTFFTAHDGLATSTEYTLVKGGPCHKGTPQTSFCLPPNNADYAHVTDNHGGHYRGVVVAAGGAAGGAACYVITDSKTDTDAVNAMRLAGGFPSTPTAYRLADLSHNMATKQTSTKTPSDSDNALFGGGLIYGTTLANELRSKRSTNRSSKEKAKKVKHADTPKQADTPVKQADATKRKPDEPQRPKRNRCEISAMTSFTVAGTVAGFAIDLVVKQHSD